MDYVHGPWGGAPGSNLILPYSEGCCLRNWLIEIRSPVLQAISQLILEIGPTAAAGGGEGKNEVTSGKI